MNSPKQNVPVLFISISFQSIERNANTLTLKLTPHHSLFCVSSQSVYSIIIFFLVLSFGERDEQLMHHTHPSVHHIVKMLLIF